MLLSLVILIIYGQRQTVWKFGTLSFAKTGEYVSIQRKQRPGEALLKDTTGNAPIFGSAP